MERIGIVDSDSAQRDCMALAVRTEGFDVQEAGDYERGLAMLGGGIDLVLIDLMIPGGRALELARQARVMHPQVDVIITGGYSLSRAQLERVGLDPAAFVSKPYSMSELCRFVERRVRNRGPAMSAAS